MNTKIRLHDFPARTYARVPRPRDIPLPSYESACDTAQQVARTRAGAVCGVVIAALVQFVPDGAIHHGPFATLLALGPAVVIAAVAFPLIAWMAQRDEARLKIQYGIRRKR